MGREGLAMTPEEAPTGTVEHISVKANPRDAWRSVSIRFDRGQGSRLTEEQRVKVVPITETSNGVCEHVWFALTLGAEYQACEKCMMPRRISDAAAWTDNERVLIENIKRLRDVWDRRQDDDS